MLSFWRTAALNSPYPKQRYPEFQSQAMRHMSSVRSCHFRRRFRGTPLAANGTGLPGNDFIVHGSNISTKFEVNHDCHVLAFSKQNSFTCRNYFTILEGRGLVRYDALMTHSVSVSMAPSEELPLKIPKAVRCSSTLYSAVGSSLGPLQFNSPYGRFTVLEGTVERDGRKRLSNRFFMNPIQCTHFSTETSLKPSEGDTKEATLSDSSSTERKRWTTTTNTPLPSRKLDKTAVPTPHSAPITDTNPLQSLQGATPKSLLRKGMNLIVSGSKFVLMHLLKLPGNLLFYATHPAETKAALIRLRDMVKEEAHHYWVGTKLLWADIVTARKLLNKTLEGSALTRRERKQLLRTVSDLFRLIPFSMFVIVPFMEFALPFALRIFPNMLPSTYQDSLKAEENMKRELKSRIAMAQFFQETLEELAKEQKRKASKRKKELEEAGIDLQQEGDTTIVEQSDSAGSMLEFLKKARNGEMIPPDVIIRYATYFKDDLTLDNMPRMQLINMCKYMGIQPYGSDSFLRFQLRHKIRVLKEDDQRILWEGIGTLTKQELREACQERGMRSTGLSKEAYRRLLQEWLNLSVNKDLPIALLIMSRTFFLREEMFETQPTTESKSLAGLADAISGMDKEILNEVILEVATTEEKRSDPDVRKIKLEVLSQQNELIRKEEEAREADAKKKASSEKAKVDKVPAASAEKAKVDKVLTEESAVSSPAPAELKASPVLAEIPVSPAPPSPEADKGPRESVEEDESKGLSTEEMDVISQLITADPVSKERQELERIKAAMKVGEAALTETATSSTKIPPPEPIVPSPSIESSKESPPEAITSEEADRMVKLTIEKLEMEAAVEAEKSTQVSLDDHVVPSATPASPAAVPEGKDVVEDPIISRLKKRVESMVDKIEVQLSDVQIKIGDKLHFLDKDRDGIMSREEMAAALQQVLKRHISLEEAMEIAEEMDENHDGVFTVEELIRWIDEHKLVNLVMEGRDAEMDRIMEKQASTNQPKGEEAVPPEKVEVKV